tara:strand:+ start:874 stop:1299 length:426 start_codon:yes stop_codon:yes gene_type:complete
MFKSLKHLFESFETESTLFNHADDEAIHVALASLLYHILSCDGEESAKEKHEFSEILRKEFTLNNAQIASLYNQVKMLNNDSTDDLYTIDQYLKKNPTSRMLFMEKLNHLISLDGVKSRELDFFAKAKEVLFPALSDEEDF